MHLYIVVGPETRPNVAAIDPRMSLSYLACRAIADAAEVAQLNKRTFGCNITQAWPAFEHDVLVHLTTISNVNFESELRGLAAAMLMRKGVQVQQVESPFAALLKPASKAPAVDEMEVEQPKPKRAAKAPKVSALQSLLS
jgi:hypothetical protein